MKELKVYFQLSEVSTNDAPLTRARDRLEASKWRPWRHPCQGSEVTLVREVIAVNSFRGFTLSLSCSLPRQKRRSVRAQISDGPRTRRHSIFVRALVETTRWTKVVGKYRQTAAADSCSPGLKTGRRGPSGAEKRCNNGPRGQRRRRRWWRRRGRGGERGRRR